MHLEMACIMKGPYSICHSKGRSSNYKPTLKCYTTIAAVSLYLMLKVFSSIIRQTYLQMISFQYIFLCIVSLYKLVVFSEKNVFGKLSFRNNNNIFFSCFLPFYISTLTLCCYLVFFTHKSLRNKFYRVVFQHLFPFFFAYIFKLLL